MYQLLILLAIEVLSGAADPFLLLFNALGLILPMTPFN